MMHHATLPYSTSAIHLSFNNDSLTSFCERTLKRSVMQTVVDSWVSVRICQAKEILFIDVLPPAWIGAICNE